MDPANKTKLHVTAAKNGYHGSLSVGRNLPATGSRPARKATEFKDVMTGTLCDAFEVTIISAAAESVESNSLNLVSFAHHPKEATRGTGGEHDVHTTCRSTLLATSKRCGCFLLCKRSLCAVKFANCMTHL